MRSLFFKIFLWFWLAQGLMGAVLVLVTVATWPRPQERGWQDVTRDTLSLHSTVASTVMGEHGLPAVKDLLTTMNGPGGMRLGVFDAQGREITGRSLPVAIRRTAIHYATETPYPESSQQLYSLRPMILPAKGEHALGAVWMKVRGKQLILAGELPRIEMRSWGEPAPLTFTTVRDALWPVSTTAAVAAIKPIHTKRIAAFQRDPLVGISIPAEPPVPDANTPYAARTKITRSLPAAGATFAVQTSVIEPISTGWELPIRLLAVFLTGGLVCYGMARYLATPAGTLQKATRRLADGDLSTRVGPAMGRRRDELADLGRDFDRMAGRLENLVLSERRLLADISHELRSPLTRLQVALELARQDAGAKAQPSLKRIEDEADRLNALIGQLLTLTRLENGLPGGASRSIDLRAVLCRIAEDADYEAQALNKNVTLMAAENLWTSGDVDLVCRAVENVVRNAVRYTAPESTVEIELAEVTTPGGNFARIQVRDHGPGVPETQLNDMFRPFYRVNAARDAASGGVGLGLSITDRAVRLHGGTVKASNIPGAGLVVEIDLPVTQD